MKQAGYHGVWGAASVTDSPTGRGTSGGVAVMCPSTVQITNPPLLADAVLVPARAIAGHVHTACKAGVVVISVYLWVDENLGPKNLALLMEVSRYVQKLQALGYDWVVGGDFNMSPALAGDWARATGGILLATTTPTCTQSIPGTVIDFFVVSENVAIRSEAPYVHIDANIAPHRPVAFGIASKETALWIRAPRQPSAIPTLAPPGCGRYPHN